MLAQGVLSRATVLPGRAGSLKIVVDGDPLYRADTTRRAVELLLKGREAGAASIEVVQKTGVPVGCGFGASAASAISACYAVAAALGIKGSKAELAYPAHVAEILQKTGLGTVSVAFDGAGAGAIVSPGAPGVSRFVRVRVPRDLRVVTASMGPYRKSDAIADPSRVSRIRRLGDGSLRRFMDDPTLETLASEGERFAASLGLMTPDLQELLYVAKKAGAIHASQNMIGYAIHALVRERLSHRVARALSATSLRPRVDVFRVASRRAGVLRSPPRR